MSSIVRPPPLRFSFHRYGHRQSPLRLRNSLHRQAISDDKKPLNDDDDDDERLLPEEDWAVQGGGNDSLSSNTPLGQAVRSAVDELEQLSKMEEEVLDKAYALLEKLIDPKDDSSNKSTSSD